MPQDFAGVMHEWGSGKLHSGGSGQVVKSQKQALAIAFSEQRQRKGKHFTQAATKGHGEAARKLLGGR